MRRVSVILGTRPEAIKLAPVILAMKKDPRFDCDVCVSAQHRQMLDQVLETFDIKPDADLNLMQSGQTLGSLTARVIGALDDYLAERKSEMVLVQGDTTTAFCAALTAFYHGVQVGHIEAGLRTGNKLAPFPEEINRVLISKIAHLHFAPTSWSAKNLTNEGVPQDRVHVTGNTVIDALFMATEKIKCIPPTIPGLPLKLLADRSRRIVLVTGHRRENFGDGFEAVCHAIATLAKMFIDVEFVYPVHLNPNVREPVFRLLQGATNIHLIEPLDYLPFVALMERCYLVLTDSGGVQEEAPSLGKPVLVMRNMTERPEGVEAGTVRLVGVNTDRIIQGVHDLLDKPEVYKEMAHSQNPYGDGKASQRILAILDSVMFQRGKP